MNWPRRAAAGARGAAALAVACLDVFGTWAFLVRLEPAAVAASPLLGYVFALLDGGAPAALREAVFDACLAALRDLLRAYAWEREPDHAVLGALLPGVLRLEALYDAAAAGDDEERAEQLANLFCDAANRAARVLVVRMPAGAHAGMEALRAALLALMVKLSRHPSIDIAQRPLHFWIEVGKSVDELAREPDAAPSLAAARAVLAPTVTALVDTFISQLRCPADFARLSPDRQDDFRHEFR